MNRRLFSNVTLLQLVTLLPLLTCSLSGCNWSTTTLALENPNSSKSSVPETSQLPEPATVIASPGDHSEVRSEADNSPTVPLPRQTNVTAAQLVGRWKDSFFGERTLVLNTDGTAEMRLDLDLAGSLLYGNQVDFDMKWSLDQGAVTIDILKGKPETAAKSLMDTWGTQHIYLLDLVESERIEMRDKRHLAKYTLQRLPE